MANVLEHKVLRHEQILFLLWFCVNNFFSERTHVAHLNRLISLKEIINNEVIFDILEILRSVEIDFIYGARICQFTVCLDLIEDVQARAILDFFNRDCRNDILLYIHEMVSLIFFIRCVESAVKVQFFSLQIVDWSAVNWRFNVFFIVSKDFLDRCTSQCLIVLHSDQITVRHAL